MNVVVNVIARVLAIGIFVVSLDACGDSKPPKTATTTPPPDESASPSTTSDAGSVSSNEPPPSSSSASSPPPSSGGDAGASASTPKQPVIVEAKDECTPVGVDFEKRARPKLKDCYGEAKKKSPNLEGTVKIKLTIDVKGKIKAVKVVEKTLPDSVAECMLKVVKATPFPEVEKCWDSTITIPMTFPTPK